MTLKLKQVRPCDGKCCDESPRWPDETGKTCKFRIPSVGKELGGCKIMLGLEQPPATCHALQGMTGQEAFEFSCQNWPQNSAIGRSTGGCCWQWVEDVN